MKNFGKGFILTIVTSLAFGLVGPVVAFATVATVPALGTAESYSVFGAAGITNTGLGSLTHLWGDVGDNGIGHPGLLAGQVDGTLYTIANVTIGSDITNAYGLLDAQTGAVGISLSGIATVTPGLYTVSAPQALNGTITLDGPGVYVFRSDSSFTVSPNATMKLINGATACNVFWQIPQSMTIGSGAHVEGTIITQTASITLGTDATLKGRALTGGAGQVTLLSNLITQPTCVVTPVVTHRRVTSTPTPIVPIIGLLKVPTPLALPLGPGSVTYNYTVWNVAKSQNLIDVTVVDDKCSPLVYVSGDRYNLGVLDLDEKWNYTCTSKLNGDTTNTAIATAHSSDGYYNTAIATAIATVVVGKSVQPPLIHIIKIPNQLTPFPFGGSDVTYTYTVTNPGVVAMNNVKVTDDKCSNISFVSGDTNSNNLLDVGESWIYSCKTNVKVSTGSVATAKGDANNFTALAYSFVNVLVAVPTLPDTAFGPQSIVISWLDIILALAVIILSVWLSMVIKRGKNNVNI